MSDEKTNFEGWAIIGLFGHQQIAGLCSEQPIAGTNMLRVDVPAIANQPAFTRFFGGGAIYSIIPTDELTARTALGHMEVRPVDRWVVPDRPAQIAAPDGQYSIEVDADMDEDHF
jgi:hypothetical protein